MLRFIDLGDQIIEGERQFTFYDTVTDSFCVFSGTQVWNSRFDFINDFDDMDQDITRYLVLIPDDFE